ncbi:hypothetical protein Zmor_004414 [Zophobas morio]|uniref:J domain-containing protein n=1 Tax=Zophobas morio TaxID=2755281 RepID=A0AA38HJW7_9CUCU|nr:hypothetical protein Zmor_004414 [Zophobas morio]
MSIMEDNNLDVAQTIREFSETEAALEVERILKAFKLNPWEQLGVDIDASTEEINKQYRKRSLLVHPDRCKHPQAKIAFQLLATAKKEIEEEGRAKKEEEEKKELKRKKAEAEKNWEDQRDSRVAEWRNFLSKGVYSLVIVNTF